LQQLYGRQQLAGGYARDNENFVLVVDADIFVLAKNLVIGQVGKLVIENQNPNQTSAMDRDIKGQSPLVS
jgi:hypothetical protein